MAVCQNLVPLVNIKIAGKWMFIPLKMVLIGIDPYPYQKWIKSIKHAPDLCRLRDVTVSDCACACIPVKIYQDVRVTPIARMQR